MRHSPEEGVVTYHLVRHRSGRRDGGERVEKDVDADLLAAHLEFGWQLEKAPCSPDKRQIRHAEQGT